MRLRFPCFCLGIAALVTGCATWSGLRVTPAGQAADWREFDRVVIGEFAAAVPPARSTWQGDHAAVAETAAAKLGGRVAAALRATGQFTVAHPDAPGGPPSLLVGGVVTKAIPGSAAARDMGDEVAGRAEFAAAIEIREAASARLLAALRVDRRTWNVERHDPVPETLEEFIGETARKLAAALVKARKTGHFPAAGPAVE